DIGVDVALLFGSRMGDRSSLGIADLLRVSPQCSGLIIGFARLPGAAAFIQLGVAELDSDPSRLGIDGNDVAIAQQRDRTADRRLRAYMADAEAAGAAGEATISDQRHVVAYALPVEGSGGREHLAHARPAARSLV